MGLQDKLLIKSATKAFKKLGLEEESNCFTIYVNPMGHWEGFNNKLTQLGIISITQENLTFLQIKRGLIKNSYEDRAFNIKLSSIQKISIVKLHIGYVKCNINFTDGKDCSFSMQNGVYKQSFKNFTSKLSEYLRGKLTIEI